MEQFSRKQTYLLGQTATAMFAVYTLFASPLKRGLHGSYKFVKRSD